MVRLEDRFTKVADLYDRHRPGYPDAVVEWLASVAQLSPGAKVLDVGCGTGISARLFAARGFDVTGVDPNAGMLEKARARDASIHYAVGNADATGLPDATFALAFAAQAFHWFPLESTMRELRRVLVPGGVASAFWNVRAQTPAMVEYEDLLRRASPDFAQVRHPPETIASIRAFSGLRDLQERTFDNAQIFDWEQLHGRAHSSSYVAHGVADVPAFDRELRAIFDRHQQGGRFVFAYQVQALAWRF